jgi:hypothetical protein
MWDRDNWLDNVALGCNSTLSSLTRKAELTKEVSEKDQILSEICMGYLYLLHMVHSQGVLEDSEPTIGDLVTRTLH